MTDLYWHCLRCGANDPVELTGDEVTYDLGDREPCTDCGDGTAYVCTIRTGACYEQGRALGMSQREAWVRAVSKTCDDYIARRMMDGGA